MPLQKEFHVIGCSTLLFLFVKIEIRNLQHLLDQGWQFLREFHSSRNRGVEEWQIYIPREFRGMIYSILSSKTLWNYDVFKFPKKHFFSYSTMQWVKSKKIKALISQIPIIGILFLGLTHFKGQGRNPYKKGSLFGKFQDTKISF